MDQLGALHVHAETFHPFNDGVSHNRGQLFVLVSENCKEVIVIDIISPDDREPFVVDDEKRISPLATSIAKLVYLLGTLE